MSANAPRLRLSSLAVSCMYAGCKHCLPTIEKLSQVRCRNKKRRTKSSFVVCVRQNLVFQAIFGSVSDDKYFFAIVMKSVVDDKHWLL